MKDTGDSLHKKQKYVHPCNALLFIKESLKIKVIKNKMQKWKNIFQIFIKIFTTFYDFTLCYKWKENMYEILLTNMKYINKEFYSEFWEIADLKFSVTSSKNGYFQNRPRCSF
jgi:hypothetical protein